MSNGTATSAGSLRKRRPSLRSRRFNRKRFLAYQVAGFFGAVLLLHVGYNSDRYLPASWTGSASLRGESAATASVRTLRTWHFRHAATPPRAQCSAVHAHTRNRCDVCALCIAAQGGG